MELEEQLTDFAERIQSGCGPYVGYDEVQQWPKGRLEEFLDLGVLIKTTPAKTVDCTECWQKCPAIEPTIEVLPNTGDKVGLYVCKKEGGPGLIKIPLERLRRWEIVEAKLEELRNENKSGQPGSNVRGMSWQEAQKKAVEYIDANGFPGIDKLYKEVGCVKNTMYKAIRNSRVLKDAKRAYDARRKSAIKALKAVGLSKKTLVKQEQTTEMPPEIQAELNLTDRDTMVDYIISKVQPENQKMAVDEFASKSDDEIRDIYAVFLGNKEFYTGHKQA